MQLVNCSAASPDQHYLEGLLDPSRWAEIEFQTAQLPDRRLHQRLLRLITQMNHSPTITIPQACRPGKATKAAYRFIENDAVKPAEIFQAHAQATVARLAGQPVVLVPQDTSSLNLSHLPQTQGLGPIGDTVDGPQGFWLHSALALTEQGQPLGLLLAKTWVRDPKDFGQAQQRHQRSLEEKESIKWLEGWQATVAAARQNPDALVISICDREGDVYEVLAQAAAQSGPKLGMLLRLRHDRKIASPQDHLFAHLAAQTPAGHMQVRVPRHEGQKARLATLTLRFTQVSLAPPSRTAGLPPITVWLVEATEEAPPAGVEPIHWRLLSTHPITQWSEALRAVQWYARRWQIEVFHRVLKSGCRVEAHQFETVRRHIRMLMLHLVVAWRVMALTLAGREQPDWPADVWLEEDEWKTLSCWAHETSVPPSQPPKLGECVRWIGLLGGWMGRKSDGPPGPMSIWRGLQRLHDMTVGFRLAQPPGRKKRPRCHADNIS